MGTGLGEGKTLNSKILFMYLCLHKTEKIVLYITKNIEGACGVTVIVIGSGLSSPSSNPEGNSLYSTYH